MMMMTSVLPTDQTPIAMINRSRKARIA